MSAGMHMGIWARKRYRIWQGRPETSKLLRVEANGALDARLLSSAPEARMTEHPAERRFSTIEEFIAWEERQPEQFEFLDGRVWPHDADPPA